jgi:hypothetical protein
MTSLILTAALGVTRTKTQCVTTGGRNRAKDSYCARRKSRCTESAGTLPEKKTHELEGCMEPATFLLARRGRNYSAAGRKPSETGFAGHECQRNGESSAKDQDDPAARSSERYGHSPGHNSTRFRVAQPRADNDSGGERETSSGGNAELRYQRISRVRSAKYQDN